MSTSRPTMSPSDAASVVIFIAMSIGLMLFALVIGSFLFHSATMSKQYTLARSQLIAEVEKIKNSDEKDEEKTKKLTVIEAQFRQLEARKGVYTNVGDYLNPVMESREASTFQAMLFHTEMGRTIALSFIELNNQISWMLGFSMMGFMQQFITQEIILVSPNVGRAYASAASVCFLIYFLHKILYTTANQTIQRRMGGTVVFDTNNPAWTSSFQKRD